MEVRRGLLALCLLCIIPAGTTEPQVLVSIPSLLKSGETEKACLTVKRHTDPVEVSVILEAAGGNHTVINEQFPPNDVFKNYDFQVPEVKEPTPVFLLVSALGTDYNYTARRSVVIAPTGNVAFIRTDKELYKGGQNVQIFVLSMDNNLHPVDEVFPVIYVTDPAGNRLHQWRDQSTQGSFLLLTFTMLDDPDLGTYQIIAERQSDSSISKEIKAEQYILPRFSVMLKSPSTITILDQNITVEVKARYTYDQGVPGKVSGRLCRLQANYYAGSPCFRNPDGICVSFTGDTDSEGTYTESIPLSSFQLDRSGFLMTFTLQATLTEQGTNVQVTESNTVSITSQLGRAYFDDKVMLPHFKKGIPLPVGIIVENALGQPDGGQVVQLQVDGNTIVNLTSDENGKANYEVDTSAFSNSGVQLQLIYKQQEQCYDGNWILPSYSNDNRYVGRFFSRTNSFVQLQGPREELKCGTNYSIKVQYTFGKEALAVGETTVTFAYMVMSRAKIVESGEYPVDVSQSLQGEFTLTYETSPEHVPVVQYVVYYLLKDEVVGDVISLNLESCFTNQVSASFSSEMGTPGSNVSLDVTATPESACLTRVFDSSLQLLGQGQTFSGAMVYNALQYIRLNGYYEAGFNVAPPEPSCIDGGKQILLDGIYWSPASFPQEQDVGKVFSDIGMHVITDTPSQQPRLCSQPSTYRPFMLARPEMAVAPLALASFSASGPLPNEKVNAAAPEIISIRKYFPEVWYFGTMNVGESGTTLVPLEVPGTITKWNSDVVCLSKQTGFGMTKDPANFTSFQKMFVELSLPDSIVRGEIMLLVASVANYMDKCAKVQVSLQDSDNYTAEFADRDVVKCVCSQERVSFFWNINATSIGVSTVSVTAETIHIGESCEGPADPNEPNRIDTIIRSFLMEPQGIKQQVTKTDLVCVNGTNSVVQVGINPSGNIVPGSLSAKVQVIGDMLGRTLTNPEALFVEPTGCGEQNLATLMPIVRALEVLNLTGRLTEEARERALQNLAIGYVRQMRFRHSDGSFSAFGPGRSMPSGWLTVLTLRTLWEMRPYTFIDEKIFIQGVIFLEQLQNLATGGFRHVGTMFNSGLKGGADDDVGFTCAVFILLSQTSYAAAPSLLRPAFAYLDAASRQDQSVFNYVMLFYAFRVSGNVERSNAMQEKLLSLAIDEGDSLHWERGVRPSQRPPYLFAPRAPSAELELTAITLSAMSFGETRSTVSQESLNKMAKISNWLSRQQNMHGSYSSTSDTVAVLDALCSYGALVYQKDATNSVQLRNEDGVLGQFNVDQPNRILLQSETLPQVPGNYSIEVSGNGCVLLQTGVEFNVPIMQENAAFSLSLTTFPEDCKNGVAYSIDIQVNASYHGIQNTSNMVLLNLPLLSGYSVNNLLKLQTLYPKAEVKNNHLIVYFNDMTSKGTSFNVTLEMGSRVDNFQPRTAVISDYYEKDENGSGILIHPCTLS